MGTRWRGLLAPINQPTGDGRRMATGAFRHRPLPLPLKWQREDEQGHDASVVIGLMDTLSIDDKAGEVWGEGELFDDQPQLPRLSEDVAEALLLTEKRVIGPSVDAGAADAILVEAGSDEPLTEERMDELWMEAMESGTDPDLELLFTDYEIAAATLVAIPAFVEARPFELVPAAADDEEPVKADAALVASLTAAAPAIPADVFADPQLADITPITVEDRGEGFLRVRGLIAAAGICHLEFREACVTAPTSQAGYVPFHRYAVDVDGGMVAAGRVTTGHGRAGTGCTCCRGKDDHACSGFGIGRAISHYDQLTTLAWVRAGEDEAGNIWVAGIAAAGLDRSDLAVLSGQRFSGDWRDVGGNLELVEVLALSRERPGFPIPATSLRDGRQVSLTAAGAVRPPHRAGGVVAAGLDYPRIGREVVDVLRSEGVLPPLLTPVTAAAAVNTRAMVALRMTEDDAARLAVDGGEPADELHLTLCYLGEGADFDADARQAVIDALTGIAAAPVIGEPFSVSVFNPTDDDKDTAIVLGLSGDEIAAAYEATTAALSGFNLPEQHAPFVAHVTLIYSDDLDLVEELVDRTEQPVTFDRIRVAFAGEATDIPLGAVAEDAAEAAALAAEIDAAIDADVAAVRSREANHLLDEMMSEEGVRV